MMGHLGSIYIYIQIYIHTRGRMVKSSPGTPRLDNFITWLVQTKGPDLYRSKGVWRPGVLGGFFWQFGIFEKNRLVGFISYNDMYIYIYYLMIYDMYTFTMGIQALSLFFLMVFIYSPEVLAVEGMAQKFVFHAVHMQLLGLAKKVVRKVDESPGCCM